MNDDIYHRESFIPQYSHSTITRKLTDMTKQSRYSTTGILQLTLHITENHLTLKSKNYLLENRQKKQHILSI